MDGKRRDALTIPVVVALTLLAGCASGRQTDVLEARLRQQQQVIAEHERSLAEVQDELQLARRDATQLRTQMASSGASGRAPEVAEVMLRAEGIQFNTLMTRGLDRDGRPGDEGITAVILPVDGDGDLIKVPGSIELEALDLSQPEKQRTIGRWTFTPDEAREHWKRGFITSGYVIDLPWQQLPSSGEIVLYGRLVTTDGRTFAANHTVTIDRGIMEPSPIGPQNVDPSPFDPGLIAPDPRQQMTGPAPPRRTARLEELRAATSEITPVSFETAAQEEPVGRASLADVLGQPDRSPKASEMPAASHAKPKQDAGEPKPFPQDADAKPVRTSDRWTDETLPFVR